MIEASEWLFRRGKVIWDLRKILLAMVLLVLVEKMILLVMIIGGCFVGLRVDRWLIKLKVFEHPK